MIRLFVALNIPQSIKEEIIRLRNTIISNSLDYKWETPDKLHLTIKFIGEVEENLVEKIQDELTFINEYKEFNCTFTKFGFFYSGKEPKILWLGLNINEEIFSLVERLNEGLVKFGIEKEKKRFKPHLTLMRVRKNLDKNFINSFENCKLPYTEFLADSISLIKSELLSGGSKYKEIKKYKLHTMGGR